MTGQPDPTTSQFELGTDGPSTIVVGIDDTAPSWRALHYAAGLARRESARLVAVHAHVDRTLSYLSPDLPPPVLTDDGAELEQFRQDVTGFAKDHGIDLEFLTTQGDPVTALTAAAAEHHADLIVVGASAKPGHRLFGSTAIRTVWARCCPVTVVP